MMRNHMYQGRKRPRREGDDNNASSVPPTTTTASSSSSNVWSARGGGGASAGSLAAPARHYTSTQPDIEDYAGSGGPGGPGGAGSVLFSPPLFAREELAPTYHHVVGAVGSAAGAETAGSGDALEDVRGTGQGLDGDGGGGGGGGGGGEAGAAGGGGVVVLGCPHYRRACKMRAPCCQRLFTCRLCHDQAADHTVDREEVKEMLCMRCGTLQPMHRWGNRKRAGGGTIETSVLWTILIQEELIMNLPLSRVSCPVTSFVMPWLVLHTILGTIKCGVFISYVYLCIMRSVLPCPPRPTAHPPPALCVSFLFLLIFCFSCCGSDCRNPSCRPTDAEGKSGSNDRRMARFGFSVSGF